MQVKGGTFIMGYRFGDSDERPVCTVTVSDFAINKYEVTHAEFIKFLNSAGVSASGNLHGNELIDLDDTDVAIKAGNSFYFSGSDIADDDKCPVMEVTWYGAVEYCNWLSIKKGLTPAYSVNGTNVEWNRNADGYRLPTEAEWAFVAKGGDKSNGFTYAGSNVLCDVAWYKDNSCGRLHPVGLKKANELGLFDMTGNVWEWSWDWKDTYPDKSRTDPAGPPSGKSKSFRGGCWSDDEDRCRIASRYWTAPYLSTNYTGFRLVLPFGSE